MRTNIVTMLLLTSCIHSTAPHTEVDNRVCAIMAISEPRAVCHPYSHSDSSHDVATIELDGGARVCWETFDDKILACPPVRLSNTELAALQEQRRKAEIESAKKEATEAAKVTPKAEPTVAEPTVQDRKVKSDHK